MRKLLIPLISLLVLSGCNPANANTSGGSQGQGQQEGQGQGQQEGQGQGQQTQTESDFPSERIPTNSPYSLTDFTDFTFSEGREPVLADNWNHWYGTTHNPISTGMWEHPTKEYSGVELMDKKQYLVSPLFDSWSKLEIRLEIWCSAHSGNKYKAADNEPQLYLKSYTSTGTMLNKTEVNIQKSDIPSNSQLLKRTYYIFQPTMSFFTINFNNFIANGNTGYTAIIHKVTLKGWPYSN